MDEYYKVSFLPQEGNVVFDDFGVPSNMDLDEIRDGWFVEENLVVVEAQGDISRGDDVVEVVEENDNVLIEEVIEGGVKDDGDAQVEELEKDCYLEWDSRRRDKRNIEDVYREVGSESFRDDGTQQFVWD